MIACNTGQTNETAPVHRVARQTTDSFGCNKHTILAALQFLLRQPDVRRLTVSYKGKPLGEFHVMPGASPSMRSSIVVAATDLVFFVDDCTVQVERDTLPLPPD